MSNNLEKVRLVDPKFGSNLTDLIIELDYLRRKTLQGTTHPKIFFQLKHIFHMLESIGSARIEGNNTTVLEYVETKLEQDHKHHNIPTSIIEISNISKAMEYIEDENHKLRFDRKFISELHQLIVADLPTPPHGEGDSNAGNYRNQNVIINKSQHVPPEMIKVPEYMQDLLDFINNPYSHKYDLLKIAIAHHRFVWIHPFNNGNGRTVRLLTYAMLVNAGFNVSAGRIINPTAVFCSNRNDYYSYLSKADSGEDHGLLEWCEYVLNGLKVEVEKIDKLLDYKYLEEKILQPAIDFSLDRQFITHEESLILKLLCHEQVIQANHVSTLLNSKSPQSTSRKINNLLDKKMIEPESPGKRKYILRFDNNYLLRGIMDALDKNGFLPIK